MLGGNKMTMNNRKMNNYSLMRISTVFVLTVALVTSTLAIPFMPRTGAEPLAPPNKPNTPDPANRSTGVSISADLSWNCSDPDNDTLKYDVYFGTTSPPKKIVTNQSKTSYDPGIMNYTIKYYWQIIAWDNHSETSIGPQWEFTTETNVNTPPVFGTPSPANGSINNLLSLTWSIPINDHDGDLFSWTIQCSNGQKTNKTGASNGTKSLSLLGLAYSTTYKVWVNATDPTGSGLYTRKWFTFTTQQQQNSPPNKPNKPSGPASGKPNTVYTYSTSTTDPNGNQVYYQWDWGDGSQSNWLGPYNSGATISTTHTWGKGSYSIKVKAKDTIGAESNWSDPFTITMPKNSAFNPYFTFLQMLRQFFEQFPHAFPLVRYVLGW
jgi:hypothetical protein